MQKFQIVGKSSREYTDKNTGEVKKARELHVMYEPTETDEFKGQRVEVMFVPSSVKDDIFFGFKLGDWAEAEYEIRDTRNGKTARLIGVWPVKG